MLSTFVSQEVLLLVLWCSSLGQLRVVKYSSKLNPSSSSLGEEEASEADTVSDLSVIVALGGKFGRTGASPEIETVKVFIEVALLVTGTDPSRNVSVVQHVTEDFDR